MRKYHHVSNWLSCFIPAALGLVVLSVVACRATTDGADFPAGDVSSPVLQDFIQIDESRFMLMFSESVVLEQLAVYDGEGVLCAENVSFQQAEPDAAVLSDGMDSGAFCTELSVETRMPLIAGGRYVLSGTAVDGAGNSLLFQIPFTGYNNRVPGLVLSEIRTGYSKPKVEFVELYVHTPGNLAGVTLYNAADDKYGEYVFPAAEVDAGEYIVVHYRSLEEQRSGCIDETNDDLNASTAADSVDGARDFWIADANARLADSDVVLLRERSGGQLMDAVLFAEDVQSNWKNETLTAAAAEAVATGVWQGDGTPATAAVSAGITLTRTLCRQNIPDIDFAVEAGLPLPENNAGCWGVVKTSGCTPGTANSTEMYEPK